MTSWRTKQRPQGGNTQPTQLPGEGAWNFETLDTETVSQNEGVPLETPDVCWIGLKLRCLVDSKAKILVATSSIILSARSGG